MSNLRSVLYDAQQHAPSYLELKWDGAPVTCGECGKQSTPQETMVKLFTPDGKSHTAVHADCVDMEWLHAATYMGRI